MAAFCKPRKPTRQVYVRDVAIGGDAPISIQSMCTTDTEDERATREQIEAIAAAGADIVRVAVPAKAAVKALKKLVKSSPVPLVADIHFDPELALFAIQAGADAIRINPGNIGGIEVATSVFKAAKEAHVPVRIGVNAGSLESDIAHDSSLTLPEKLAVSAKRYVETAERVGFYDIVLSAKSHNVQDTVLAYRALSETLPDIPLHLGVTEAGDLLQGTVKNAVCLSTLLQEGIGDTLRISLTADPVYEIEAARALLLSLDLRQDGIEFVTCPTCARTKVDLIEIAASAKKRFGSIQKPLVVALMGCAVNGPGEAKDADIGVAFGDGKAALFVEGKIQKTIDADLALDELATYIESVDKG